MLRHLFAVVAAAHDRSDIRVEVQKFTEGFFASHATDDGQIQDHEVVGASYVEITSIKNEGFFAVARDIVFVIEAGQHATRQTANVGIVVHEEHATCPKPQGRGATRFRGFYGLIGFWEQDGKDGSFADDG